MSAPWPLLRQLRQGDIEQTALVDAKGDVIARVSAPEAYQGDMRTAVERGDLTAQIVSACAAAPDLYAALSEMVLVWIRQNPGCEPPDFHPVRAASAALAKASAQDDRNG